MPKKEGLRSSFWAFVFRHLVIAPVRLAPICRPAYIGSFAPDRWIPDPMPATRTPAQTYDPANPLFVQPDRSILLETFNPKYAEARDAIAPFAELEKSPEHIHTYRVTNLSLWNAAAAGFTARQMVGVLQTYTKFPLPTNIPT